MLRKGFLSWWFLNRCISHYLCSDLHNLCQVTKKKSLSWFTRLILETTREKIFVIPHHSCIFLLVRNSFKFKILTQLKLSPRFVCICQNFTDFLNGMLFFEEFNYVNRLGLELRMYIGPFTLVLFRTIFVKFFDNCLLVYELYALQVIKVLSIINKLSRCWFFLYFSIWTWRWMRIWHSNCYNFSRNFQKLFIYK